MNGLIWKPGNHEGFQMDQISIRNPGSQEGILNSETLNAFPGFVDSRFLFHSTKD
jgi:hypothetical protein